VGPGVRQFRRPVDGGEEVELPLAGPDLGDVDAEAPEG
jgi:hypothetical protein